MILNWFANKQQAEVMNMLVSLNKRMEDLWNFNEIIANKVSNLNCELELFKMDLAKIKEQQEHSEKVQT